MGRALTTTGWPRTRAAGTVIVNAPDWLVATEMFSSGRNTLAPASGWPWSESTRPVRTAACPCADTGATRANTRSAPTKSVVERKSFVMPTSEGLSRTTKESEVLGPSVSVRPGTANGCELLLPGKGARNVGTGLRFQEHRNTETKRRGCLGRTGYPS